MRSWTPQTLYELKPWRGLLCLGGAGIAIDGGATLQMRQDYRANSKWCRDAPP